MCPASSYSVVTSCKQSNIVMSTWSLASCRDPEQSWDSSHEFSFSQQLQSSLPAVQSLKIISSCFPPANSRIVYLIRVISVPVILTLPNKIEVPYMILNCSYLLLFYRPYSINAVSYVSLSLSLSVYIYIHILIWKILK